MARPLASMAGGTVPAGRAPGRSQAGPHPPGGSADVLVGRGAVMTSPYHVKRPSRSIFVPARGLRHHLHVWGDTGLMRAGRPPLVMLHGWMDVAASFQFIVDACAEERQV